MTADLRAEALALRERARFNNERLTILDAQVTLALLECQAAKDCLRALLADPTNWGARQAARVVLGLPPVPEVPNGSH